MTRKEFWNWLNTHPISDFDIHDDGGSFIVIGFPFEEDKEGESIDEYLGIKGWENVT